MKTYVLKRIIKAVPILMLLTIICFFLIQIAPYDAIDYIATPQMNKETIERLRRINGLDKPVIMQYVIWVKNLINGDLGYSIITHESIKTSLIARIPNTAILMIPAYLISNCIAVMIGLFVSSRKHSLLRKIVDWLISLSLSIPFFWFCLLLLYVFGYLLDIFPISGMHSIGETGVLDFLKHYFLPFICLIFSFLPDLIIYVETSADIEFKKDYITVQKAMGATNLNILFRHVSVNVLMPILTKMGMELPMIRTGSLIVETVFSWPGMGSHYVKAIQAMDYPVVMTVLFFSGSLVILGNLLSDISYFILDPRISS